MPESGQAGRKTNRKGEKIFYFTQRRDDATKKFNYLFKYPDPALQRGKLQRDHKLLVNLRPNNEILKLVIIDREFKFARTFCLLFGPSKSRTP